MTDCFFNPIASKYRTELKRTQKIEANMKKWKLIDVHPEKYEYELAFMTIGSNRILLCWFIDSCASRHLSNHRKHMFGYSALTDPEFVNAVWRVARVVLWAPVPNESRKLLKARRIFIFEGHARFNIN